MGFRFQKLYAGNYRCYHTYQTGHKLTVWIWQKGREICIEDLHHLSPYVYNFLLGKTYLARTVKLGGGGVMHMPPMASLVINTDTFEVVDKVIGVNDEWQFLRDLSLDEDERYKLMKEFYRKFRQINILMEDYNAMFDLLEGRFEITGGAE
jgi:hypothetical protein